MPIYMDLHIVPGVKAKEAAEAHRMDILIEEEHDCKCMTYWIDEARGHVFCLIDAPDKQAVEAMHDKAHGLVPHKIIEVQTSLVESFLGRVHDPVHTAITANGLPLISDPTFRILLLLRIADAPLLIHRMGREKAGELIHGFNQLVRSHLALQGVSEAEHDGNRFIVSFTTAGKALACAMSIQREMGIHDHEITGLQLAMSAGEPVSSDEQFFGDTIRQAERLCFITRNQRLGISAAVSALLGTQELYGDNVNCLLPADEKWLTVLFEVLEQNAFEHSFGQDVFCKKMAMSRSQLYRRVLTLTGFSPNELLREYRLQQAKKALLKQLETISGISFATGFSSPSYFIKCFKTRFGLSPLAFKEAIASLPE